MRKRTIKFIADSLYWGIVIILPVILYLIYAISAKAGSGTLLYFDDILSSIGLFNGNIIQKSIEELFGSTGILPLINDNSTLVNVLSYFVIAEIVHLCIDFLLFIPRLCHKFMSKFTQND